MTFLDLILLLGVFTFVIFGLWWGFIHAVGALVGNIFGVLVAGHYVAAGTFGTSGWARVIAFIVIMVLVNRVIGIVFWVIEKIFKIVAIIPFLTTFNRLLGGLLGFIEGTIIVGGALYIAARYPIGGGFAEALAASQVGLWLLKAFGLFAPLLPDVIQKLKSVI